MALMHTLLMIDDDEKLVDLMRDYLEPNGFKVVAAHEGHEGLAMARSVSADLVILDIMLPGMDGFEVCREIRMFSKVPILMLTARGEDTDRIVGLEMGADDYLPKPFNPRELLARIRAILRRMQPAPTQGDPGRHAVGGLILDVGSRSVTLDGVVVDLTTAEFDLLHVLVAAAGRVLSRDQLMQRLHGTSWSSFDRSIDVLISRIRSKIEIDAKRRVVFGLCRRFGTSAL